MERIGFVETEGGPLILIDAVLAQSWSGIDEGDYQRACEFFDLHPEAKGGVITVGSSNALLWEIAGAGTSEIYKIERGILVLRAWLSDEGGSSTLKELSEKPPQDLTNLGEIEISSAAIVVLWATENAQTTRNFSLQQVGRPQPLNLDNAGLIIPLVSGKYEAKCDFVKQPGGEALRLHLHVLETLK